MKMQRHEADFETKMDMTPLIDCVFLLIMFFILTTQITVNLEDLTLPFALEGKPPKPGQTNDTMLILNVRRKADSSETDVEERRGEVVFGGKKLTNEELYDALKKEVEVDAAPKSDGGRGRDYEPGPNGINLSQLEILIRYDRNVRAEYLRQIFEECQKVGIYKLKLATTQPQDEG